MLTWNRKAFTKDCFDDFFRKHACKDFRFFIIDNGSTDGTVELLKEIASKDERFFVSYNQENKGLQEYKKLLKIARNFAPSDYIVIVDDDVIEFPTQFDKKMVDAMNAVPELGFLALDVIQDEKTNGAKPTEEHYTLETIHSISLAKGPVGGWCVMMRTSDLKKLRFWLWFKRFSMKNGEDGALSNLIRKKLNKFSAILHSEKCLHATGPYYSKKYGFLERDIEKYKKSNLTEFVEVYSSYRDKND